MELTCDNFAPHANFSFAILLKFKRCVFFFYHLQAHGRVEEDQRELDECIPGFVY